MELSHSVRVLRLYRHALQSAGSWAASRSHYRKLAMEIRSRFDENKSITNIRQANALLAAGEVSKWIQSSGV